MSRNPYGGDERSCFIGIARLCCSQKALRGGGEQGAAAVNVFYYANKKYTQAD